MQLRQQRIDRVALNLVRRLPGQPLVSAVLPGCDLDLGILQLCQEDYLIECQRDVSQ